MIEVKSHISVTKQGLLYLDLFKIKLLEQIFIQGSLRTAAKNLKISYQHAWNLIDQINKLAPEPIVFKKRGGANGGGAEISNYGRKIIREYKQIEIQVNNLIDQINVEINF